MDTYLVNVALSNSDNCIVRCWPKTTPNSEYFAFLFVQRSDFPYTIDFIDFIDFIDKSINLDFIPNFLILPLWSTNFSFPPYTFSIKLTPL